MWLQSRAVRYYAEALGLLSALCVAMYVFRVVATSTTRYSFIPENLVLAWIGLFLGWALVNNLKKMRWLSWQNLALSAGWLVFLPNTWYVLTDFLHVYATGEISELYDIVMVGLLVLIGFTLGFTSLYIVHRELAKRLSPAQAWTIVEGVILISSFAVYLGRVERWSSWDLLTNTSGVVINVSDRVIDPLANLHAWNLTGLFFVVLSVCYIAFTRALKVFETSKSGRQPL